MSERASGAVAREHPLAAAYASRARGAVATCLRTGQCVDKGASGCNGVDLRRFLDAWGDLHVPLPGMPVAVVVAMAVERCGGVELVEVNGASGRDDPAEVAAQLAAMFGDT